MPSRDTPLWFVWAPLAVALTTVAAAVFPYGLDRWTELLVLRTVRVRDVAIPVAVIVAITMLAVIGTLFAPGLARTDWRGVALVTIAILGSVPSAGVMYGIRHVACDESVPSTKGQQVALLVALRRLLQRLLTAVGSLVALMTLASSAVLTLQGSLSAESGRGGADKLPPQLAIVAGAAGSLVVGLFYVPAGTALRDRGQRLCNQLFPLDQADKASDILTVADDRSKLEQLLGLDRGLVADLQTGLVILGPLLASAAANFLPP